MLYNLFNYVHSYIWKTLPYAVLFSCAFLIFFQLGFGELKAYLIASIAVGTFLLLFNKNKAYLTKSFNQHLSSSNSSLLTISLFGVLVRILWIYYFPTTFTSDSASYVTLANQLINGGSYEISGTKGYWPPGYPFFLYLTHFGTFEVSTTSVSLINLILFTFSALLIFKIGKTIHSLTAGLIGTALFVIWPTHIALSGIASKELLVFTLLLSSFWLYVVPSHPARYFLIGLILGASSLVQPSTQLFFLVFIVANWAAKKSVKDQFLMPILCLIGMVLIISPWSYRNYQVFDEIIPISTNGGYNLYRANNELATGSYTESGKVDLSHLDELEQSVQGNTLAKEWITNNPTDFLALSFKKIILFLGDDSVGVYESNKRSAIQPIESEILYLVLKLTATAYWVVLWVLLLANIEKVKLLIRNNYIFTALGLSFLYLLSIHSIFESNAKYHIPVFWALIVLVASICSQKTDPEDQILD